MSFWQVPCVVDNIAFILLEPRCVQLNLRGASLLFFISSGDDRYISRAIWELCIRNKKKAGTAGQPVTPLRPPLKQSKEEQPEGNRADKQKKGFVKVEEKGVLLKVRGEVWRWLH